MATWRAFEQSEPEMAGRAKAEFALSQVALIGTVRSDGSPRISNVEPFIVDGELTLGMMWRSRKAVDLLRDPRLVLRNAVATNIGNESEIIIRGRAVEVQDEDRRARFVAASGVPWREPLFHLFSVEVDSVAMVTYGSGIQSVALWPSGRRFERPYT